MWGGSTPAAADEENDSIEEEDEDGYGDEGRVRGKEGEWGLEKGMELFEVSAKDGVGKCSSRCTFIPSDLTRTYRHPKSI